MNAVDCDSRARPNCTASVFVMCTKAVLRAPPLRLPALRHPHSNVMIGPTLLLHKWNDGPGTTQSPDILHIEVLPEQVLVDEYCLDGADCADQPPGADPLLNWVLYGTQLLGHLGDHAVNLLPAGDVGHERKGFRQVRSRRPSLADASFQILALFVRATIATSTPSGPTSRAMALPNTPTPARHDGPLPLQSEVHGSFSPLSRPPPVFRSNHHALFSHQDRGASATPVGKIAGATYRDGQNRRLAVSAALDRRTSS